jgi:hypothetical protein
MPAPPPAETMPTASPRLVVNHLVAVAESGVRNAPAAKPTIAPNVRWRCQRAVAWLERTIPRPRRNPPAMVTRRLPRRSDTTPQQNEPAPMAIQLIIAVVEMALRLQCIDSSSGFRNTPSAKSDPCPKATTVAAAASTTQP